MNNELSVSNDSRLDDNIDIFKISGALDIKNKVNNVFIKVITKSTFDVEYIDSILKLRKDN
jgi:hypothetical protein